MVLLVFICGYLKSVPRYKFLILDTYHLDTIYYMSKNVRNHGYFSKPEGVCKQNSLGNNALEHPAAVILRVDPSTC
jgi:hypothetical protein